MAYLQTQTANRKAATIGAVALLHGAAIVALVSGFAATITDKVDAVFSARSYPAEPPPPPPSPTVEPQPSTDSRPVVPQPQLDLDHRQTEVKVSLFPTDPPTNEPGPPIALPPFVPPSPSPSFAAISARPLGNPGNWATTADYPAGALRAGRQGTTRFRVTVGSDGRVRNCEVTGSSGSSDLDHATCENVARRARFKPATDETGQAVSGTYSNAITWVIPD